MVGENNDREEIFIMDTPERCKTTTTQIGTSITKIDQNSPVFNFLNNLSPIKPVKSIHISQTINPLTFTSLPSVFTSPHVTSLRESRFLRRHQLPDPSKPEFASDDGRTIDRNNVNIENQKMSDGEVANETSLECSRFVVEFGESFSYATQRVSYSSEVNMDGVSQIDDQNKEVGSCDWESLISEATDMLIFESPKDTDPFKKPIQPETRLFSTLCGVGHSEQVANGNEQENLSTQPGEESDLIAGHSMGNDGETINYEHLSGFHRGLRRRCLVFEMGGALRKQFDSNASSSEQQEVPTMMGNDSSSRCVLPGIGLHLNALAGTPKDYKIVNHDSTSSCGRLLIGSSGLSVNFHPPSSGQELLNDVLPVGSSEGEFDDVENGVPLDESAEYMTNEEIIHSSSPKRKKLRMVEQGGEGESSCKRCNCKKSKCLKLYCECFAAGVYCVEPCACIDCFNKPVHEDVVLATRKQIESRNPLAFAPKVIRGSESTSEIRDDSSKTPASARHKRGCNCKKSGCLKKYCECYQGGVGCSINCRCEGCKNAFGRKDGSVTCMEAEGEEDETNITDKITMHDRSFHITPIQNEYEQNMENAPPTTPIRSGRHSLEYPFSSKKKPPRSSLPSAGSSSGFYTSQGSGKPSFFQLPPPKFDQLLETVREDEYIPELLQEERSPICGIKLSSPNRKRVSPPHGEGMSSGMRSSRKLILKSIPSFPSLTSNQ